MLGSERETEGERGRDKIKTDSVFVQNVQINETEVQPLPSPQSYLPYRRSKKAAT